MKKWARILILTLITVLTLSPVGSQLRAEGTNTSTENTPSEVKKEILEDPKAADYLAKLKERLAKNKEAIKSNITKTQQAKIIARCQSAQGKITSANANIKSFRLARIEVYKKVVTRLTELSTKLKEAEVDTTELDKQITELQTMVNNFETNVTELSQAGADLANMECTADPTSFKAALEVMRAERKSISDDSAAIRAYIKDTIKPTLQTIRQSVDKPEATEGN